MTAYELLASNKSIIQQLSDASININDIRYITMYREYRDLQKEGHKITYIAYLLSEKYEINKATFYRVVNKFDKEIDV